MISAGESNAPVHVNSPQTIGWGEFIKREPELARFGAERLAAAPAYMATVRQDGLPGCIP